MGSSLPDGRNDKMVESPRELGELKMKSWRLLMQGCVPDVKSDGCTLQSLNGISERDSPKYRVLRCTMGQLETIIHFLMI